MEHSDSGLDSSMTGKQRADLERIAFGRTYTRADEDAAAAARTELAEADRAAEVAAARAAVQEVVASHELETGSWSLAPTLMEDELPPPPEVPRKVERRIHPAWLVPIIAGSIAAGYFGASIAVAGALEGPVNATPSPSDKPSTVQLLPTPEPPVEVTPPVRGPGNLKQADAWFEAPPREVDGYANQDMIESLGLDPAAIRFVQTNAAGYQVWVARKLNGDLCLLGAESESRTAVCLDRDGFARSGAAMEGNGYSVTWTGSAVTVTNPRVKVAP